MGYGGGGGRGGGRGRGRGRGRGHGPTWAEWQLKLKLPDLEPGTDFGDITFACSACAAELFGASQIQRFGDPGSSGTTNCVWTIGVPDTLVSGPKVWNDRKQVSVRDTYCKRCLGDRPVPQTFTPGVFSIGSTYDEDLVSGIGVEGPCCKMSHKRLRNQRRPRCRLSAAGPAAV